MVFVKAVVIVFVSFVVYIVDSRGIFIEAFKIQIVPFMILIINCLNFANNSLVG